MAWPLARIVDSLDRGRVLFDFNPGRAADLWLGNDDFDFGTPEWESSTLGIVEGSRTISLALRAKGRAAEARMAVLSEIVTRSSPAYLQWQTRRDSEPIWFRLQRQQSANPLDFTTVWADDADNSTWRWKVDLIADAFALGARQDLPPTTGLAQSGSSISAPVEITDQIRGDVRAPLNLDLDGGDLSGYTAQLMSWAMDPAMTVAPWVGTTGMNLTYAGTTAKTDTIGQLAATPSPGQYRCLLYVARASAAGAARWSVQLNTDFPFERPATAPTTVSPSAGATDGWWLDCGRMNLPPGMDFADMAEDSLPELDWSISFQGSTAGQSWKATNFTLIPVQSVMSRAATSVLGLSFRGGNANHMVRVDAERSRVGLLEDTGQWRMGNAPIIDGSFPAVHPGARNFLMFLPRTQPVTARAATPISETKMWYYPRWLHVGQS